MKKLTVKQDGFAKAVASGDYATISDAYRAVYDASRMKPKSVTKEACKLMADPRLAPAIERYRARQERVEIATSLSDRERVLTKLRTLLDEAEGHPREQVMLRAADLLGKTCSLYKESVDDQAERSAAEIQRELQRKLQVLVAVKIEDNRSVTVTSQNHDYLDHED